MRYGIFSDVHSNLEALKKVADTLKNQDVDRCLCLGDIVGYGASPGECLDLVKNLASKIIAGNHDWATAGKFDLENFNSLAKDALVWTRPVLSLDELRFLSLLPLVYEEENFVLAHGTLYSPENFFYLRNTGEAIKIFSILKKQICFVGHTHRPEVFIEEDNGVLRFKQPTIIRIENGKKYIINVGSVGQPRDNDPRACFAVYDSKLKVVELKRLNYDYYTTQEKIIKAKLPEFLAKRLMTGV